MHFVTARQKAKGRRQAAEGGRQKAESKRQKAESKRQKAVGRRQKAESRRQLGSRKDAKARMCLAIYPWTSSTAIQLHTFGVFTEPSLTVGLLPRTPSVCGLTLWRIA